VLSEQIENEIFEIAEWKNEGICWLDVVSEYFKGKYKDVDDGY
jgi:hypothetical protein